MIYPRNVDLIPGFGEYPSRLLVVYIRNQELFELIFLVKWTVSVTSR
jgi:hypothetical protein